MDFMSEIHFDNYIDLRASIIRLWLIQARQEEMFESDKSTDTTVI